MNNMAPSLLKDAKLDYTRRHDITNFFDPQDPDLDDDLVAIARAHSFANR